MLNRLIFYTFGLLPTGSLAFFGPAAWASGEIQMAQKDHVVKSNNSEADMSSAEKILAKDSPVRDPETIRWQGNHLSQERSTYLLQHANNPVDWYPWGEEALTRAREENKPIFLSIGYASCHWCHVMEHEVFEDDQVADLLNRQFISIKVDREERPDLDAVYMDALVATTGGGGWPMSMFLLPDLKPFFGATYVPRDDFKLLLERMSEAFDKEPETLAKVGQRLFDHIAKPAQLWAGELDDELFDSVRRTAVLQADREWGGSLARMKFPMPVRYRFLLQLYRKTGDGELASLLRLTLDKMASGGLQDHLAGGFHRYTVERTWLIPHFEKMLYDNALLASLYLEAAAVFPDAGYDRVAADVLDFLLRDMSDEQGGLLASFDADQQGEEGSFYVWDPDEIRTVVGEEDGPVLAALLGVTEGGNFEGRNILTRRVDPIDLANRFERDPGEVAELFDRYREALRQARSVRPAPGLDRKVVTSWNGLAISALAQGYRSLGDERYLQAAQKASEYLLKVHRKTQGGLYRVSNEGQPAEEGILDDYAFLTMGLLDLYQAGGEARYLSQALELLAYVDKNFAAPGGGFYLTPKGHEAPLGRQLELADGVRPSGNGILLQARFVAAALSGDSEMAARVNAQLDTFGGVLRRGGLEVAASLNVALWSRGPFYEVVVAGDDGDELRSKLLGAINKKLPAQAVVVSIPASGPSPAHAKVLAGTAGKKALGGKATAFVCQWGSCKKPTHDPKELLKQVGPGWVY